MADDKWASNSLRAPSPLPGELNTDYRTRLALEQHEAQERRRRQLAEQSSHEHAPDERIRIWERLHFLKLPTESAHPLLNVIAIDTGLKVAQIVEEQKRRAAAAPAAKTKTPTPSSPV